MLSVAASAKYLPNSKCRKASDCGCPGGHYARCLMFIVRWPQCVSGNSSCSDPITRKNSLFAGSDGGGRTSVAIATLLQTAKMNNVDPLAWLTQTLERIGWPDNEVDALMPWNYAA